MFHSGDDMLQMVKIIEETFDTLQPLFARKIKFLDLMIMKGEGKLEWAMRIDEVAELADLESIKAQDLKLMKYCQCVKAEDKLYDLLMDMEPKG